MSRKEPLTKPEIDKFNSVLIKLCEFFDLEFAVACAQGDGPLEIFEVCADPKWAETTEELRRRMKAFSVEATVAGGFQRQQTTLMKYMTEPELSAHLSKQLRWIKACQTDDTIGSMLVIFQDDGITQYGATIDPETAPQALRELADRIEQRQTVKR